MTHQEFLAKFGGVYEASPWVAEALWPDPPGTWAAMAEAMRRVVDTAPASAKLALIRAHPELASRARMADASVSEQAGAGLDQCTPEEFEAFQALNSAYNARFGFPFIVAVKGLSRGEILEQFRSGLTNDPANEFDRAIAEIHKIAAFRLADLL